MAFTSASTLGAAFVIMAICQVLAITLAVIGGAFIDMFYDAMILSGILNIPGSLGDFSTLHYLIGLYYMACIGLALYGIFVVGMTVYHKYIVQDDEEEEEETTTYTGGNY